MAMCTVDKVKDGGVCRKRLLHYCERKIEIVLPEKLIKKTLTDKREREKNKIKFFKKLISFRSNLATYKKLASYLST